MSDDKDKSDLPANAAASAQDRTGVQKPKDLTSSTETAVAAPALAAIGAAAPAATAANTLPPAQPTPAPTDLSGADAKLILEPQETVWDALRRAKTRQAVEALMTDAATELGTDLSDIFAATAAKADTEPSAPLGQQGLRPVTRRDARKTRTGVGGAVDRILGGPTISIVRIRVVDPRLQFAIQRLRAYLSVDQMREDREPAQYNRNLRERFTQAVEAAKTARTKARDDSADTTLAGRLKIIVCALHVEDKPKFKSSAWVDSGLHEGGWVGPAVQQWLAVVDRLDRLRELLGDDAEFQGLWQEDLAEQSEYYSGDRKGIVSDILYKNRIIIAGATLGALLFYFFAASTWLWVQFDLLYIAAMVAIVSVAFYIISRVTRAAEVKTIAWQFGEQIVETLDVLADDKNQRRSGQYYDYVDYLGTDIKPIGTDRVWQRRRMNTPIVPQRTSAAGEASGALKGFFANGAVQFVLGGITGAVVCALPPILNSAAVFGAPYLGAASATVVSDTSQKPNMALGASDPLAGLLAVVRPFWPTQHKVQLLAHAEARDVCELGYGTIVWQDPGQFYIRDDTGGLSTVSKSAVARVVYDHPQANIRSCDTSAPSAMPVKVEGTFTPMPVTLAAPAVNVLVAPQVVAAAPMVATDSLSNLTVTTIPVQIQLPPSSDGQAGSSVLQVYSSVVFDGTTRQVEGDGSWSYVVLPIFTDRVESGSIGPRPNTTEYADFVYQFATCKSDITPKPSGWCKYELAPADQSLLQVLEPISRALWLQRKQGCNIELEVRGYASQRSFDGVNDSDPMNWLLAEGRRVAVLQALGFEPSGKFGSVHIKDGKLTADAQDETSPPIPSVRVPGSLSISAPEALLPPPPNSNWPAYFQDQKGMKQGLEKWLVDAKVQASNNSSDRLEEAFQRSVVLALKSEDLSTCRTGAV